jgi:YegS/Rv2252/BmrU family lipid kinase
LLGIPTLIVINPISGPARRGRARDRLHVATSTLERLGVRAEVRLTERAGHARELAQAAVASGVGLVIAWGGDGTINEVGRAIVEGAAAIQSHPNSHPTATSPRVGPVSGAPALGIIPGGSGNGLARELGIPFDPARAIEHALGSTGRTIDAGELGGRLFFNIAGIGLDAHVAGVIATRVNQRGLLAYLMATGRDLLRYLPGEYSIEADGKAMQMRAMFLAFANSRQYGFGARIAPAALLDDGLLDLVIVEDRKLAGNLLRLPSLFAGTVDKQPGITVSRVREVTIRSKIPMLFHVDGEPCDGKLELAARVHAGALNIRA